MSGHGLVGIVEEAEAYWMTGTAQDGGRTWAGVDILAEGAGIQLLEDATG